MDLHAILTPESALQRQYWRGLSASMQLNEKRYIKRAGVAGIALRADAKCNDVYFIVDVIPFILQDACALAHPNNLLV
ncbi:hypothetical protein PJ912_15225 [Pectobacterium colocasium]|uniref:hypothetical protein n=1 Tax=Pectobacterium TaxID=122277 RepID=UPI00279E71BE|nr:hypothetical protein PJ912_15225 [Pectobacterium colocasium]